MVRGNHFFGTDYFPFFGVHSSTHSPFTQIPTPPLAAYGSGVAQAEGLILTPEVTEGTEDVPVVAALVVALVVALVEPVVAAAVVAAAGSVVAAVVVAVVPLVVVASGS